MSEEIFFFPASFAQQRLWFLDQLMPGNPFYNVGAAIRLDFRLDVSIFERCLNEIVRRHEILRTTFTAVDGEPFQTVTPERVMKIEVEDLQGIPPSERSIEVQRRASDEATRPFDLAKGPLMRSRLLRLSDREWVFLLTMHHIISDGWSLGLLFQELSALYTDFTAGRASRLPALPLQYADFAMWQRKYLQGDTLDEQLAYWKQQLDGAPVLNLPTDRPRPMAQTFRGANEGLSISYELTQRVKALSRQQDATLFMTLLAAFTLLLHHYTGQDDIIIGLPVAGRNHRDVEALIGFFINSLVLRTDLSGDPTFLEVLGRVRQVTLNAFAHQDLPFEKLVEELQPTRDLSRNPLFQVTFQLINAPTLENPKQKPKSGNHTSHAVARPPVEVQRGTAMFDLALDVLEGPDGLLGHFEYSTDLFEQATVRRMAQHFQVLLSEIIAHPERRSSELTCLSDTERHQVLEEWNCTSTAYPTDSLLHEFLETQTAAMPEATAVSIGDAHLTYRELNERANRLARYLRKRGVGPDTLVGICLERSLELVVALFATLKAGGAYVPLDPAYPKARLDTMLARVVVILTQSSLLPALPEHEAPKVSLDRIQRTLLREGKQNLGCQGTPDNLAYVLYTSGSTGRPKGVMISHRAICNHMHWINRVFPLTPEDRVLQRTSTSFDASVWEFFAPIMAGARLVLAPPGVQGDPNALKKLILDQHITIMQIVPSLLRPLLDEPEIEQCTSLRHVFCGGEALPADLQARFFSVLPAALHNLYGPTEATIDSTCWSPEPGDDGPTVPIGRPIDNARAYVLDAYLHPSPIGVPGQLYIAGTGLARGYLDQPDLTAERFLPDPYSPTPGGRMYATGDRVRTLPNGALQFLERVDLQVKLRGFRIELGEIEETLRQHSAVRQAVVAVKKDTSGEQRLVAYILPTATPATVDELRQYLRAHLPDYMIPSYMMMLETLPLTPNGKLDRRSLPAPERGSLELTETYLGPRTPLEKLLARLWADVLQLDQVGILHNFFNELGGHSLLATQLISRVRNLLGVEVPLQRIFEAPTIADFAASLLHDPDDASRIEQVAELFLAVDQMSEDEVDAMLADSDFHE